MDVDLQDPPEAVIEMVAKWREGYDVVYGTSVDRPGESAFKLATTRWFYRILNKFSDVRVPPNMADFRLIDRKVVDVLRAMPERDCFVHGMVTAIVLTIVGSNFGNYCRMLGCGLKSHRKIELI